MSDNTNTVAVATSLPNTEVEFVKEKDSWALRISRNGKDFKAQNLQEAFGEGRVHRGKICRRWRNWFPEVEADIIEMTGDRLENQDKAHRVCNAIKAR